MMGIEVWIPLVISEVGKLVPPADRVLETLKDSSHTVEASD